MSIIMSVIMMGITIMVAEAIRPPAIWETVEENLEVAHTLWSYLTYLRNRKPIEDHCYLCNTHFGVDQAFMYQVGIVEHRANARANAEVQDAGGKRRFLLLDGPNYDIGLQAVQLGRLVFACLPLSCRNIEYKTL